jgi:hypothetical protein
MSRLNLWYLPPAFFSLAGHGGGQLPAFPAPSVFEGRSTSKARTQDAPRDRGFASATTKCQSRHGSAAQLQHRMRDRVRRLRSELDRA